MGLEWRATTNELFTHMTTHLKEHTQKKDFKTHLNIMCYTFLKASLLN